MIMNKIVFYLLCIVFACSCKKDRYLFTMKTVTLNKYNKSNFPDQNLFIKVIDTYQYNVIAKSETNPSTQTLPTTYNVAPHPQIHLYKDGKITIELWGDSTGYIGSSTINMKEYKIQFPLDMETTDGTTTFTVAGTWE